MALDLGSGVYRALIKGDIENTVELSFYLMSQKFGLNRTIHHNKIQGEKIHESVCTVEGVL